MVFFNVEVPYPPPSLKKGQMPPSWSGSRPLPRTLVSWLPLRLWRLPK